MTAVPICTPVSLPAHLQIPAARRAGKINPANLPLRPLGLLPTHLQGVLDPPHLAMLTSRYWGAGGVRLTVSFLEDVDQGLAQHILYHMNAWSDHCNVLFTLQGINSADGQVRITLRGSGYWSYLGTDILLIPAGQPTMCLRDFDQGMPESEFVRVIRHEAGHGLGMIHEHLRRQRVAQLDRQKTIAYFMRTQGWSAREVEQQVLTPVEDWELIETPEADEDSIMCYQLPGEITLDGQPIRGGTDIDDADAELAGSVYPKV